MRDEADRFRERSGRRCTNSPRCWCTRRHAPSRSSSSRCRRRSPTTEGTRLANPPLLVPVLRAGLGMADAALGAAARVVDGLRRPGPRRGHLRAAGVHGVAAPRPDRPAGAGARPDARHRRLAGALLPDCSPTGAATEITVLCVLAAPVGIERLERAGLPLRLVTASIDERLNDEHVHRPRPRRRRGPPVRRHAPLLSVRGRTPLARRSARSRSPRSRTRPSARSRNFARRGGRNSRCSG